jgi:hypothetical protein
VAREGKASERRPVPPALPPEERTVGQLVAEAIRFYGGHFWRSLALGLGPAAAGIALAEAPAVARLPLALTVAAALASLSYALATGFVAGVWPARGRVAVATAIGTITVAPAALLLGFLGLFGLLPAVAWLGFVGLVVPVIVVEGRTSFRRAIELGRVDLAHSIGSLATLTLVALLTA